VALRRNASCHALHRLDADASARLTRSNSMPVTRRWVRESPRPVSRIRPFVESTLPCHGRPNESELSVSPEEAR
jgi:hypothetical protein